MTLINDTASPDHSNDPAGKMPAAADATIIICMTCRRAGDPEDAPRPGGMLATLTAEAAAGSGVCVRRVRCLANCKRGLSAAIRREDAWTYVFGDLDAATGAAALIEGARLLGASSDGLMPWRGRPEPLKRGMIARIPPIDYEDMP